VLSSMSRSPVASKFQSTYTRMCQRNTSNMTSMGNRSKRIIANTGTAGMLRSSCLAMTVSR
jgi:hypothetical protein